MQAHIRALVWITFFFVFNSHHEAQIDDFIKMISFLFLLASASCRDKYLMKHTVPLHLNVCLRPNVGVFHKCLRA